MDNIAVAKDMVKSIVKYATETKKDNYKEIILPPMLILYPNIILTVH